MEKLTRELTREQPEKHEPLSIVEATALGGVARVLCSRELVETVIPKSHIEQNFADNIARIQVTLDAFSRTPKGHTMSVEVRDFNTFLQLPQTFPYELAQDPSRFVIKGHSDLGVVTVSTSGSSGSSKEVKYSEEGATPMISEALQRLLNRTDIKPLLIADEGCMEGSDIVALEHAFKNAVNSPVKKVGFTFPQDFIDRINENGANTAYTYLNPALLTLLLDGLTDLKMQTPEKVASLKGKRLIVETGDEKIEIAQLEKWHKQISELFGTESETEDGVPLLTVLYAQTEQLKIGTYHYTPGDDVIVYEINKNKFVLALDDHGNPVEGQVGRIEVTDMSEQSNYAGTTVLPRYMTGDIGVLHYGDDGTVYLSGVDRDPRQAMVSIMGEKIFLDLFAKDLQKAGLSNINLNFQMRQTIDRGHSILSIALDLPQLPDDDINSALDTLKQVIEEHYPSIGIAQQVGSLKLSLEISTREGTSDDTDGITYKLLKREKISLDEYRSMPDFRIRRLAG